MKDVPALFEEREIRRSYDEEKEVWYFSVVDVVRALTAPSDYQAARKYWKVLKGRLAKEGSQVVTDCYQLKTRAADTECPVQSTFGGVERPLAQLVTCCYRLGLLVESRMGLKTPGVWLAHCRPLAHGWSPS